MKHIGIDGCKAGWVVWSALDSEIECHIVAHIGDALSLLEQGHTLIDIPIGFSDADTPERLCDKAARQFLRPKRSASVFPVPCRDAAFASSYEEACEINLAQLGKKLSKQTWFILPKVKQVDSLLEQFPHLNVRESHPEVVFAALNGEPLEFGKKTPQGLQQRLALIESLAPAQWVEQLHHQMRSTLAKHASKDDLIDAFILMLVARLAPKLSTLPAEPDRDTTGKVREIVYWQPK